MINLFRIGPVLMLVPVYVWAWGWNIARSDESFDWYIVWPMYGFLGLAGLWHIALIIMEQQKRMYVGYAVIHMPIFYLAWGIATMIATRFPPL